MGSPTAVILPLTFYAAESASGSLEEKIVDVIKNLATMVGAPEYVRTPQFAKRGKRPTRQVREQGWGGSAAAPIPGFKPTVIKKREGTAGRIDRIRKHINKMSPKTFEALRDKALSELDGDMSPDEMVEIAQALYGLLSGNGFYGELYAKFYLSLAGSCAGMRQALDSCITSARESLTRVEYCDPTQDYDQFCLNNRLNSSLRAGCAFLVHLSGTSVISSGPAMSALEDLQRRLEEPDSGEGAAAVRDELAERVYAMLTANAVTSLLDDPRWSDVIGRVQAYSIRTSCVGEGFTAKSIFRHLDILDSLRARKLVKAN